VVFWRRPFLVDHEKLFSMSRWAGDLRARVISPTRNRFSWLSMVNLIDWFSNLIWLPRQLPNSSGCPVKNSPWLRWERPLLQTDPSWTPLFVLASAVVVGVGAPNSHALIVSCELGIPCVSSLEGAIRKIPEGAIITVDGSTGTVTIDSLI